MKSAGSYFRNVTQQSYIHMRSFKPQIAPRKWDFWLHDTDIIGSKPTISIPTNTSFVLLQGLSYAFIGSDISESRSNIISLQPAQILIF